MSDDYSSSTETVGAVAVGSSATGDLETGGDRDWFAVTLRAGFSYRFDLEGSPTSGGTLSDPYLRGIYDASGNFINGTTSDDHGTGLNSLVTFTAAEDGVYYVSAGAFASGQGTYTLSVTELTPADDPVDDNEPGRDNADDYTAGIDTIGTVAVGGSATGNLETGYDLDWFAVTLEAGFSYQFDLEGSRTAGGTLSDPYLRGIYDASGNILNGTTDDDAGDGYNSRVSFTAAEDGVYYMSAGAFGSLQGTYTVSVTELAPPVSQSESESASESEYGSDFTNRTDTAGAVAVGGSATGEIGANGDHDWFAVTLQAGNIYQFDLQGRPTNSGTLGDPILHGIRDASGNLFQGSGDNDHGHGNNSRVVFMASEDGVHYISAGGYRDRVQGTYTLSVADVTSSTADDYTADTGTAASVAVDGASTGVIEFAGDRDWFAVTLVAGTPYQFDLKSQHPDERATLFDPYLAGIHDAAGNLIAGTTNDDSGDGLNGRVEFTPTENGVHYVSAGTFSRWLGAYTLTVADVTPNTDDYLADTDTTGAVAVGGSVRAEIELVSDIDWFAVTLEAGKTYQFDLEGLHSGNRGLGTLSNPYLGGIHDAAGTVIENTSNDNGGYGRNSRVVFTATEDATYYVSAGAREPLGSQPRVGTYTLSVTDVTDDFTTGIDTAGAVVVGGSATGRVEVFGDRDWFAVTLQTGKIYYIDLEGSPSGDGTLRNPYLYGIHDAQGDLIDGTANNDFEDSRNSRVAFMPTADGVYYISAGALESDAWYDPVGTYKISVTDSTATADDYAAATGTAGSVAVGGSSTGEIEFADDQDWFAVTLEDGNTYQFDLLGSAAEGGTNIDPYLSGIHDAQGDLISGTRGNDIGSLIVSRVTFTATGDGVFYVSAAANESNQGTYTLNATNITPNPVDDYTAGTDTTGIVAVDGAVTGEIGVRDDRDWFAVTLEQGSTYEIDLQGSNAGTRILSDPFLRGIHDAAGNLIAGTTNDDYDRSGRDSQVTFTATEDAIYYVSAGAYGPYLGFYLLSVTDVTTRLPDDYTAGIDTAGEVEVDGSAAAGEIENAHDHDWFAVALEQGKTYQIDLQTPTTGDGALTDPYLRGIHDAEGSLIAATTDNDGGDGLNSRVTFTAGEREVYYVSVGANESLLGAYALSVTDVTPTVLPDDYTAGTDTAGEVEVGGSAAGEIENANDHDWFAVTLEQGKTYRIDLQSPTTGDGILTNPYLRGIHDAAGSLIAGTTDNDGGEGLNSQVTFTATEGATYYVSAGANESLLGAYTLSVTDVTPSQRQTAPTDDYTAGIDTSGRVAVGGSVAGDLETGDDRDWFAVTLEAGKTYQFDLEGSSTGEGTLKDPYLRGIHDAAGNLITGTANDDIGVGFYNSRVTFAPSETATYFVAAGAYKPDDTGDYMLSVEEVI